MSKIKDSFNFMLLADGSLYSTAAFFSEKVRFDSGVRFGSTTVGDVIGKLKMYLLPDIFLLLRVRGDDNYFPPISNGYEPYYYVSPEVFYGGEKIYSLPCVAMIDNKENPNQCHLMMAECNIPYINGISINVDIDRFTIKKINDNYYAIPNNKDDQTPPDYISFNIGGGPTQSLPPLKKVYVGVGHIVDIGSPLSDELTGDNRRKWFESGIYFPFYSQLGGYWGDGSVVIVNETEPAGNTGGNDFSYGVNQYSRNLVMAPPFNMDNFYFNGGHYWKVPTIFLLQIETEYIRPIDGEEAKPYYEDVCWGIRFPLPDFLFPPPSINPGI